MSELIKASTSPGSNGCGNEDTNNEVSGTNIFCPESEAPMSDSSVKVPGTTDQSRLNPKRGPNSTCAEPNSVFVQVARLGPKDVFVS